MRRGAGPAAIALAAALLTGGCEYLLGYDPLAPLPSFDPDAPFPSPIARYPSGSATVVIDGGAPITLDRVRTPGQLDPSLGAEVTLSNDDGWYVRVFGFPSGGGLLGAGGYLTLDRVHDTEHWTTADPSRCVVTIDQADAEGVRGSATCRGLRWMDAVGGISMAPTAGYIEGEPPFDAEITFEAAGTGTSSS